MEEKIDIKFQNGFWFSDYDLVKITSLLRGKNSTLLLLGINTRNKNLKTKLQHNNFNIPTKWLDKTIYMTKKTVMREVKHLMDQEILVKLGRGSYCWNLQKINELYNPTPEPIRTEQPTIQLEKVVFGKPIEDPMFKDLQI
jgi:hypothetical protein